MSKNKGFQQQNNQNLYDNLKKNIGNENCIKNTKKFRINKVCENNTLRKYNKLGNNKSQKEKNIPI